MADRDENEVTPQPQEIAVVNDFVAVLMQGADEAGEVHVSKTQADGTVRSWTLLIGRDPNGNERIISVDEDGTLIHVPIVTDEDGNKIPVAGTEDGVLKIDISGAAKSQDTAVMNMILAELRLHSMYWEEMTESGFRLEDLGEHEPKESA